MTEVKEVTNKTKDGDVVGSADLGPVEINQIKKPTNYFKFADVAVEATKNANPSILDNLGIYRGPVFTALVSYFVLNMLGWGFMASLVGMGLVLICIIHYLIHMGKIKETLNTSIDSAVEITKEKLSRKKKNEEKLENSGKENK